MSRDQRISENLSPILREKIITIFGGQKWWKSRAWDFLGVITVYFIFTSLKFPCILLQVHRLHDLSPLYTHTVPVSLSREKKYQPLLFSSYAYIPKNHILHFHIITILHPQ
jgi:hypothetical protein